MIEVNKLTQSLQSAMKNLQHAVDDADRANHAKDNFLAAMSHELRTPLTSIIGNAEIIKESTGDQNILQLANSIEMAGVGQLALVNDILDMSKIKSGKFTINEAPYNLNALLEDIKQMFTIRAHEAALELMIEQKNDEVFLLIGDGQRIGQILINLLSNAIKFTAEGTIALTSAVEDGKLIFTVRDTGIGMSREALGRLFSRFEQVDGSISRRFGGSGLGLYISKSLAEMMGGTIEVSSKEHEGSTFRLILPYRRSEIREQQATDANKKSVLDEKLDGHVLIAEDTLQIQILERRMLEGMGLTVMTADNGREAVELAAAHSFDLILMDMQMPVMDGIEACHTIRKSGNRVPIIALTANVMQRHRDAFEAAGCDDFIGKPIDKQELNRKLSQFLGQENRSIPAEAEEEVDDELMEIFRESAGSDRLQLVVALANEDWKQVKEIAHPIKGSGTSFGFPTLTEKAKDVCDAYDNGQTDLMPPLIRQLIDELNSILDTR